MERDDRVCKCNRCGLGWRMGEMGDNETLCFKCERLIEIELDDQDTEFGFDTEDDDGFDGP